jgi:hypothetical protein
VRLPTNKPSHSRVVSIAVAVIGSVACISFASKTLLPFSHDQLKMVKNDLTHFTPQAWRQIVRPGFFDFVKLGIQPILALRFEKKKNRHPKTTSTVGTQP